MNEPPGDWPDAAHPAAPALDVQTHGVSAWTVSDLLTALALRCDPQELRPLFVPGYAADALTDLLWARAHGEPKRVRVVADLIRQAGWNLQVTSVREGTPAEVELAFAYLTNPIVRRAV